MRVLHTFAILCMSLAPRQADRVRSTQFACWRPPGRCWLWRWQAAAYNLPSPAQPPPGPSHLPRRSTAGSAAAVARCARSRRPWARTCAPHPTLLRTVSWPTAPTPVRDAVLGRQVGILGGSNGCARVRALYSGAGDRQSRCSELQRVKLRKCTTGWLFSNSGTAASLHELLA